MIDSPQPAFEKPTGELFLRADPVKMPMIPGGHDFHFDHRPITGGWDTGMWCTRCGSRMNQAPEVCPGRKGA